MPRTLVPLAAALALLLPLYAPAQGATDAPEDPESGGLQIISAEDHDIAEFQWTHRLVVVFADSPDDPRFQDQMELLLSRPTDLTSRDVIVVTDTDPDAGTEFRQTLRPRGFALVLIGKDGGVALRKPSPWSTRELARSIDKMPLRQQEIREQKARAG